VRRPLLAALIAALPVLAAAHEVLHEVERGRAVAVRARYADGEALAYAAYEVFSPSDANVPHQKGRTDRNGWIAFVPDAAGTWRVRVADETGHGVEVEVDAAAPDRADRYGGAAAALRPIAGVAAIAAIFAAVHLLQRRKAASR
jgi:nickel transport protein